MCLGCAEQQEEFYNCADIAIDEDKMKRIDNSNYDNGATNDTLKSDASLIKYLNLKFNFIYTFLLFSSFKYYFCN